ncbi:MAG: sugar transferase [Candidatus Saccharimonadales bacterium]
MPVKTVRFYTLALILADTLAFLAAFAIAYKLRVSYDSRALLAIIPAREFMQTFLILVPFWLITFMTFGLYSPYVYLKRLTEYGKLLIASVVGILIVIGYAFVIDQPIFPGRVVPFYAVILVFVILVLFRELLRMLRDVLYAYNIGTQRVLIIGNNNATADIARNLAVTRRSGFRVVAVAGNAGDTPAKVYASSEAALKDLDQLRIDTIIQTNLYDTPEKNLVIMDAAQQRHIQYCFIPGENEFYSGKNHIDVFLGYPIISVYKSPLIGWGEVVKRIFDLLCIIIASPVWIPIFLLLVVLQKIFNPGPILFTHTRLTKHSKPFTMYKFRSMIPKYSGEDAIEIFQRMGRHDLIEEYKRDFKVANDPRITPWGNFLRKSSLDEVGQMINVIMGDMSLVGPRPIPAKELEAKFSRTHGALLHEVRPGVTGLWQVSGRNDISTRERIELELYYVQNWSFWLDIKILFKTVLVVLRKTGAR